MATHKVMLALVGPTGYVRNVNRTITVADGPDSARRAVAIALENERIARSHMRKLEWIDPVACDGKYLDPDIRWDDVDVEVA